MGFKDTEPQDGGSEYRKRHNPGQNAPWEAAGQSVADYPLEQLHAHSPHPAAMRPMLCPLPLASGVEDLLGPVGVACGAKKSGELLVWLSREGPVACQPADIPFGRSVMKRI